MFSEKDGVKQYITKGINNEVEDPVINDRQIYGKVVGKVPIISEINHIVKNQYGFFFLIFLPIVLVVFLEIADTITDIKKDKLVYEGKEEENKDETEEII